MQGLPEVTLSSTTKSGASNQHFVPGVAIATAVMTWMVYDMILTLGDEHDIIWSGSWTHLKSLYIAFRVLMLASQISVTMLSINLDPTNIKVLSWTQCEGLVIWQAVAGFIMLCLMQIIVTLRVRSLYRNNRRMSNCLWISLILAIILEVIVFIIFRPKQFFCTFGGDLPVTQRYGFGLFAQLAYDCILFSLSIYKFHTSLRPVWRNAPLVTKFMQQGIWAFALPTIAIIVNIACSIAYDGRYAPYALPWLNAMVGFSGYRLILHTHQMLMSAPINAPVELDSLSIPDFYPSCPTASSHECPTSYSHDIDPPYDVRRAMGISCPSEFEVEHPEGEIIDEVRGPRFSHPMHQEP
ncbi:uncharacterized protein STEHIDRAFT_148865 [Stereum hirsutum FP-91666 SS1]|uniref:uncharacterized protein n=1 Tax=Stereum hirsutum (strain FP-91666) TaxID=721885 RepID=UPI000444963E|nr:uncharacterized protein STEHIDRAFT_148865 [Stereum hirsutum FP-91666 SS1]EIM83297.1 hypothetical protein STEHIDRAFT_148865 [Stereum hirsutum FP-91666 SS1]